MKLFAKLNLILLMSLILISTSSKCSDEMEYDEPVVAFPGAEGFGSFATGGRYGEVYIVTNLNDTGPGSFRDAVSKPNRIVVFEVGGIIEIESQIAISPNITIAAQTAPGDGIVIYGEGLSYTNASNSITRFLRVRMGIKGNSNRDAITITNQGRNMIFDHLSVSWGRDENFSITRDCDSITIQNTIMAQGLINHSCGGLLEPSGALSLYRNLYIHNHTRNPKVKGINQFVNNVIYNWGGGGAYIMGGSTADSRVNIINNYFVEGPNSRIAPFTRGTPTFIPYVEGNYLDSNQDGVLNGRLINRDEYHGVTQFKEEPYDYPLPATLMTATETFYHVVEHCGAFLPVRDQIDSLLIADLASIGTSGGMIRSEQELLMQGPGIIRTGVALSDTDRDGIPDFWEISNGLDPNDPSDAMLIGEDGYTNLERYINGLVPIY